MTVREAWRAMVAADQRVLRARQKVRPGKRVKQSVIDAAANARTEWERALARVTGEQNLAA